MLLIIISLLVLICSSAALAANLINALLPGASKVLLLYSFLFIIYLVGLSSLNRSLQLRLQVEAGSAPIIRLFNSSNHFMVSPDIVFTFSFLMLFLYQTLKLAEAFPA